METLTYAKAKKISDLLIAELDPKIGKQAVDGIVLHALLILDSCIDQAICPDKLHFVFEKNCPVPEQYRDLMNELLIAEVWCHILSIEEHGLAA